MTEDTYTESVLREQMNIHQTYYQKRLESCRRLGIKFRLPAIPEDISENIVKFIIHNHNDDRTCTWNCKGDLLSTKEGKQECKCFTSDGPISFTPSSEWGIIYFLDARKWSSDKYTLYRVALLRTSDEWKNIRVKKTQTFHEQCQQGRRPRITWKSLYPQIAEHCQMVYEGTFDGIFTPRSA